MLMTNRDFATASFVTNGEPSLFAHLAGRSKLRGRSHRPHLVRFLRAGGHIIEWHLNFLQRLVVK
jgi:hypothetical protein